MIGGSGIITNINNVKSIILAATIDIAAAKSKKANPPSKGWRHAMAVITITIRGSRFKGVKTDQDNPRMLDTLVI